MEVGLDFERALRVAGADEGVQRGVEGEADIGGVEVSGQRVLHAEEGLCVGERALVEEGGGVFGVGEGFGGEFELVEFLRGGGLGEGGGEEEVGGWEQAVVLVVEVFEEGGVVGGGGGLDERGGEGPGGEQAEEGRQGKFGFEVQEHEEDEVRVAAFDGFVEGEGVFFHGEEQRDLFAGAGLVVQELRREVCTPFVVCGARDGVEGNAALGGELGDHRGANSVFVGGGVAHFLGGPVYVDLIGREAEVFGDADGEEIFLAVDEALDELGGGEAQVFVVGKG